MKFTPLKPYLIEIIPGGKEVRYMSLDENKTNNQTDFKTGRPKDHRGFSPRDLHGNDSHRCTQIPSNKK